MVGRSDGRALDAGDVPADDCHPNGDTPGGPWHAVPGNHDIGDNPWPGSPDDHTVDVDRNQRWRDLVGVDHWSLEVGSWRLLAINAQLFGSGLEAEAAQWAWLEARLDERRHRPTALIMHKPLAAADAELVAAPPYRFVPASARRQLTDLLRDHGVALVVSGHVHQYRVLDLAGTRHVWAPTTWAVLPEEAQPTFGTRRCGVVTLELDGDGRAEPQLVEPSGLTQYTLSRDVPDPYRH